MQKIIFIVFALVVQLSSCAYQKDKQTISYNEMVLRAISRMPRGGGYSTFPVAHHSLQGSMQIVKGKLDLSPDKAVPSYCSGATYHVLLQLIEEYQKNKLLKMNEKQLEALMMYSQKDGIGIWGRWNANGPGAAKLVHDLNMGYNFESYSNARPGDFMKIFWTEQIGMNEFGHLVIYMGSHVKEGKTYIKFWSSNNPGGYGLKTVRKDSIKWAVFTRITNINGIKNVLKLPYEDRYLSSMLDKIYSKGSVRMYCSVRE